MLSPFMLMRPTLMRSQVPIELTIMGDDDIQVDHRGPHDHTTFDP